MIEFLQLYVSGFWPWLGITIGIGVAGRALYVTAVSVSRIFRGR